MGWKRGGLLLLSGLAYAVGTLGFILALQFGVTVAVTTALKNTPPLSAPQNSFALDNSYSNFLTQR